MSDERKSGSFSNSPQGISCGEFDTLLADAIDGTLGMAQTELFERHAKDCSACGLLLQETRHGLEALKTLEEIEPPSTLVHNILARTSHAEERATASAARAPRRETWLFAGLLAALRPRIVGTFAMAFFSFSLIFSVIGFNPRDFRRVDLRPASLQKAVMREYYATSASLVRYYKNTPIVDQLEATLRELRNAAFGDDERPRRANPAGGTSRRRPYGSGGFEDADAHMRGRQGATPVVEFNPAKAEPNSRRLV